MKNTRVIFYKNHVVRILSMCLLYFMSNISLYAININIDSDRNQDITIEKSQNNIPIININQPDSNGTSHNYLKEYNVGNEGVILNNGKNISNSELAGQVNPNPNLKNSTEAKRIITEVTGTNISKIEGFTEIVGESADYILANPNGVYINRAGFINVPNVTITTGRPGYNDNKFTTIDVEKGHVEIGNDGIDVRNVTKFDIISRTARLNGKIYGGREVNVILGKNSYNNENGEVTPQGGCNDEGSISLDASALGSIYAGKIYLKSSDSGVGVNSRGHLLADSNDLTIDVNGDLTLKNISGKENISINANNYVADGSNLSEGDITISTNTLIVSENGNIHGKNVNIKTRKTENNGEISSKNTTEIRSEILKNNDKIFGDDINIIAESFDEHQNNYGEVIIQNDFEVINDGKIAGNIINVTERIPENGIIYQGSVTTNNGQILASELTMSGLEFINNGDLYTSSDFNLKYSSLLNYGRILSQNDGILKYQFLFNSENSFIYAFNDLNFEFDNVEVLSNNNGLIAYGNENSTSSGGYPNVDISASYTGAVFMSHDAARELGIDSTEYNQFLDSVLIEIGREIKVPKNLSVPNFSYTKYINNENNTEIGDGSDNDLNSNPETETDDDFTHKPENDADNNLTHNHEDGTDSDLPHNSENETDNDLTLDPETEVENSLTPDIEPDNSPIFPIIDEKDKNNPEENYSYFEFYNILVTLNLNRDNFFVTSINSDERESQNNESDSSENESETLEDMELFANGRKLATALGILEGTSLTEEQISDLKEDILWYEKKIENNIEIVTAKIYLSQKTIAEIAERDGREQFNQILYQYSDQIENVKTPQIEVRKNKLITNTEMIVKEIEVTHTFLSIEVMEIENEPRIVVKEEESNNEPEFNLNYAKTNVDFLKYNPERRGDESNASLLEVGTVNGIIDSLSSLDE